MRVDEGRHGTICHRSASALTLEIRDTTMILRTGSSSVAQVLVVKEEHEDMEPHARTRLSGANTIGDVAPEGSPPKVEQRHDEWARWSIQACARGSDRRCDFREPGTGGGDTWCCTNR